MFRLSDNFANFPGILRALLTNVYFSFPGTSLDACAGILHKICLKTLSTWVCLLEAPSRPVRAQIDVTKPQEKDLVFPHAERRIALFLSVFIKKNSLLHLWDLRYFCLLAFPYLLLLYSWDSKQSLSSCQMRGYETFKNYHLGAKI